MVKIIATQTLPYGKKRYEAGEEVEVSEKDARLLVRIRRATLASTEARPTPAMLAMKAPEPAAEPDAAPEQEAAPEAQPHPQTYSTRDLAAGGPTGRGPLSPSSRRGRQPKAST